MKKILILLSLLWMASGLAFGEPFSGDAFRLWPIQTGGRIKPLDTFARETVRFVTGKEEFEKTDPVVTVLSWWAAGDKAFELPVVEVRNLELKQSLDLPADKRWFSVKELESKSALQAARDELQRLPPNAKVPQRLSTAQDVLTKMQYVRFVASGHAFTLVPSATRMEEAWGNLADLKAPLDEKVNALRQALVSGDSSKIGVQAQELSQALLAIGPSPNPIELAREAHYNHFHPFRKAWMLYLVSLVCLFLATSSQGSLYWIGLASACFGFGLHSYGFFLRCMIAGRPPVTNMYESVIWVAFGAMLFSLIFEFIYRARSYLLASSAGAVVCLVLADMLPAVLDPSIRPLTPVLRSNFWLTIHVLTITLGYAAFVLSLGLGHMVLWKYVAGPDQKESLRGLNKALYKSLQVGVLLLAAGTLLGGVWANYSWGRFWGWDPKEVWALIALLGYLSILHGRYAGWLGHFGTAAASVLAFQGVLMAWYGVNYVLGAGLHSYGFGNGGVQYVACFSLAELLMVFVAALIYRRRRPLRADQRL